MDGNTNEQVTSDATEAAEVAAEKGLEPVPEAEQPDPVAVLQADLEAARAQAAEYLDGWQRARAEFANFRKRVEAEREDMRTKSNAALLLKLLPVVDDFERAFQSVPPELAETPWVSGVAMIWQKLQAFLASENVVPIEAVGQPFDPQWHEAVMQEETAECPEGTVTAEVRRGYRLGDRVLRPSLVKVACSPSEREESAQT